MKINKKSKDSSRKLPEGRKKGSGKEKKPAISSEEIIRRIEQGSPPFVEVTAPQFDSNDGVEWPVEDEEELLRRFIEG